MFHFYFTSQISSLTDWIQAITGIVGMIALIWTLYLQRKATLIQARAIELQAKATQIEEDRDRRALLPIFSIEQLQIQTANPDEGQLKIKLERGNAYSVMIGPLENQSLDFKIFTSNNLWKQSETFVISYFFKQRGIISRDSRTGPLRVPAAKMYFYDEGNRAYSQVIYTNGENFNISLPELLDAEDIKKVIFNFRDFR